MKISLSKLEDGVWLAAISAGGRKRCDCVKDPGRAIVFLILMDLLMPEMDGLKTALEIRNKGIDTPIIALTASPTNNVRNRIEVVGIQEPFQS